MLTIKGDELLVRNEDGTLKEILAIKGDTGEQGPPGEQGPAGPKGDPTDISNLATKDELKTVNDGLANLSDEVDGKANKSELNSKVGYNLYGNVDVAGTNKNVSKLNQNNVYVPTSLIMGGTAASAGLVTRGICGVSTPTETGMCYKEHLYVNYDGYNAFNKDRQLILNGGKIGEHYGHNLYQNAVPRGDTVKNWAEANFQHKEKEWVLKGTLTTELKDSGIVVDMSGCDEMIVWGKTTATTNVVLNSNIGQITNNIGVQGTRQVYIRDKDSPFGIEPITGTYASSLTGAVLVGNMYGSVACVMGKKISEINMISLSPSSGITECDIKIYGR